MYVLDHYKEKKGLSICICVLEVSRQTEQLLNRLQEEMSESELSIRQCYVYGDQTVNASDFDYFYKDHFTKIEKPVCKYPAHEALVLAAGMLQEEAERMEENNRKDEWECLLIILGEKSALRDAVNDGTSYQTVKNWMKTKQDQFSIRIIE